MRSPTVELRVLVLVLGAAFALTTGASAQLPVPTGWKWVTDSEARIVTTLDPPEGSWVFGTMAPGWHITTRPAATLFEPTHTGRGRFVLESEMFLFPGGSQAGFGVFVGGRELEANGRFIAFLIRRDGSAAIESVEAGRATAIHPWTKTPGIVPGGAAGEPVKNALRVEAEADVVTFQVNGQRVAEVPRDGARFDGIVGLRAGADLNLHITNLDLTHRLALPRRARQP